MSARTLTCKTLTCQVTAVEDLNPDVFKVTLAGRAEAMQHAPGQYLELMLDEATWVPFSIASADRGDGTLELQIQHWPERNNSQRLRQLLQVANQLTVRLPSGDCVLDTQSERPLLLIAAGTGFAQMKPSSKPRFVTSPHDPFHYGGRTVSTAIYMRKTLPANGRSSMKTLRFMRSLNSR